MSNVFPPMLSSSPPPIDAQEDDDDETFGDFRVADLTLNLSGRCSPESLPSPISSKMTVTQSPTEKILNGHIIENDKIGYIVPDSPDPLPNGRLEPSENSDLVSDDNSNVTQDEIEPSYRNDQTTLLDGAMESSNPPPPLTYSPCNSPPPEQEGRTSPEGADSESECVDSRHLEVEYCSEDSKTVFETTTKNIESDAYRDEPPGSTVDDFDDFSDFADFTSHSFPTEVSQLGDGATGKIDKTLEPDDFEDEFDDFESVKPTVDQSDSTVSETRDVNSRISQIFPDVAPETSEDHSLTSCLNACLDDSSSVWGHLKDLETSNALTLQWTVSSSSKKLLSSLNIDSRNVLQGPRWNPSVPRFAANLGCQPLEPKKADACAVDPPAVSRIPPIVSDVVPAAQFDWNSSGLINPLDCLDKDEAVVFGVSSSSAPPLPTTDIPKQTVNSCLPDYVWNSATTPDSDILLPSPTVPHTELSVPVNQSALEERLTLSEEVLLNTTKRTDETTVDLSSEKLDNLGSWTISNNLAAEELISRPPLSPEAYRVVETLPDLSFLSAHNLLVMANQNMARFKAESRL